MNYETYIKARAYDVLMTQIDIARALAWDRAEQAEESDSAAASRARVEADDYLTWYQEWVDKVEHVKSLDAAYDDACAEYANLVDGRRARKRRARTTLLIASPVMVGSVTGLVLLPAVVWLYGVAVIAVTVCAVAGTTLAHVIQQADSPDAQQQRATMKNINTARRALLEDINSYQPDCAKVELAMS